MAAISLNLYFIFQRGEGAAEITHSIETKISVLLVCTYWGVRSSIAKALFDAYRDSSVVVAAAGFEPAKVSQLAERLLQERGLELPEQSPKTVFELVNNDEKYDYVIALCSKGTQENSDILLKSLHAMFKSDVTHLVWDIPDFMSVKGQGAARREQDRAIVNLIDKQTKEFLKSIRTEK